MTEELYAKIEARLDGRTYDATLRQMLEAPLLADAKGGFDFSNMKVGDVVPVFTVGDEYWIMVGVMWKTEARLGWQLVERNVGYHRYTVTRVS